MERLNDILRELGISKVKLAKFLGVSRQMIYNYLELDDLNKWPKDKKVMLLNLLGIKTPEELDNLKIDTDYIMDVEARINSIFENTYRNDSNDNMYNGLKKNQREVLTGIVSIIHEKLEDDTDEESYNTMRYLYYFLQAIDSSKELKYFLAYVVKSMGFVKPLEFVYNEDEQFAFESIMFSGMTLYNNGGRGLSKVKLAESHKRFVSQIEHKKEEKMSRTLELNTIKSQALKELGYTEINEQNAGEILEKMAEIQSRKM